MKKIREIPARSKISLVLLTMIFGCEQIPTTSKASQADTFSADLQFLQEHTDVFVLQKDDAALAITPSMQGRVMTSTANGMDGNSFGWINRELISSGELLPHINAFGGEERFWLGPEGGQYSIYFEPGAAFDLDSWQVPPAIDTMTYPTVEQNDTSASFQVDFSLQNYSGFQLDVQVDRKISLLTNMEVEKLLGIDISDGLKLVAYETDNRITNTGSKAWSKETGLLSIWILGMYNPSQETTVLIPFDDDANLNAPMINDSYFGKVPEDRLQIEKGLITFSGDGNYRSKIGVHPDRSMGLAGSYDAEKNVLTIVAYNQPEEHIGYVNSMWEIQDQPYNGDAINSYNDGPPSPGMDPMGPFYELETSSPAAALGPSEQLRHVQSTIHIEGDPSSLNEISKEIFRFDLETGSRL